jgi:hypothetical protein
MVRTRLTIVLCAASFLGLAAVWGAEATTNATKYALMSKAAPGARADVEVTLDVGGDLMVRGDGEAEVKLPMSVAARFAYQEQLLAWSADGSAPSRSLRRYSEAHADIKRDSGEQRDLPADRRVVVAELNGGDCGLCCLDQPLTREQFDLIGDVVGNTLAVDRLLPNRSLAEGEGWDHDAASIGALLGMDHVAACEVRSVVTGEENRQVKIRMGGTVHGTIDGAASELELRAAYLYDLHAERITKLNLAVKQRSKTTEVTPGVDVVAKLSVVARPIAFNEKPSFDDATVEKAAAIEPAAMRQLVEEAPKRGYRFQYGSAWYVVSAEQRELMSLRLLEQGDLIAHCNIATRPPRSEENLETLAEFEREVAKSLGDKLENVETAREWKTAAGHRCLAVFANGSTEDVKVQWRHYLVSGDNLPQVTISVSVDQSLLERFADADRPIVDSLVLLPLAVEKTAAKAQPPSK